MTSFRFARSPLLRFGSGEVESLPSVVSTLGARRAAVVTGSRSFRASERGGDLDRALSTRGIRVASFSTSGEPSAEQVDEIAGEIRRSGGADVVVAIGGGSAMDLGKAVAAMILEEGSVVDYLDEIGTRRPSGRKVPFVAVPTTAGTGSEATKNAVISRIGPGGFKKSLRHDAFVPDVAVVDPALSLSCPSEVAVASGLDAITQLIEGFVSTQASPITDALARSGLRFASSFPQAVRAGRQDLEARSALSYAAYLSGLVLANAGLGVVHGIASAVGARSEIPHGVVCGTLVEAASRMIIERLERDGTADSALAKYAEAGALLSGRDGGSRDANCRMLLDLLAEWTEQFGVPRLGRYGLDADALEAVAREASVKSSPAPLSSGDIYAVLASRR